MADVLIRKVAEADYPAWRDLWEQYLVFYETELPPEHTDLLWKRLGDEDDPTECLVADVTGTVTGMVQFFPHIDTWDDRPVCYLSDLYVDPSWRGQGIGSKLIRAVQSHSRDRGWGYVYWQTAEDNHQARGLYDKLTGGASGFVIYELRE
jgi:ribosomal protein S18 acetylase RimI-like enzyme